MTSPANEHAHLERRTLHEVVAYPPHAPRESDPHYGIFRHAQHHLIHVLGARCWIGGATLAEIKAGLPVGHRCADARQLEAHHAIAEFAGLNEVDWRKVAADFPQAGLHSDEEFLRYAESEGGLMILCAAPDTPVLMADGGLTEIRRVRPGDAVIGHDQRAHIVTAAASRRHFGDVVIVDGVTLTGNHPVLTSGGWVRAGTLAVGQVVRHIGVGVSHVLSLRRVQDQVLRPVVRPDSVDVMDALGRLQEAPDHLFHNPAMLHPVLPLGAVPDLNPDVSLPGEGASSGAGALTGKGVKGRKAAGVRAIGGLGVPRPERAAAPGARPVGQDALVDALALHRAGVRAGGGPLGRLNGHFVGGAADSALLDDSPAITHAGWRPIREIRHVRYSGVVHDISVSGCRSFVTGLGLVLHNCNVHHRSPARGIHSVTYPAWLLDRYAKAEWEFLGGS